MISTYILIATILTTSILAYFWLAQRFDIIDHPAERSSHHRSTIRGGGVIFSIGALLWFVMFGYQHPFMVTGLVLITVVSFVDDIRSLSARYRIVVHFLAIGLLFYSMGLFHYHWYLLLGAFVLAIGWINAFNFMDGINGMLAFNSLVALLSFSLVNNAGTLILPYLPGAVAVYWTPFLPGSLVGVMFLSVAVFTFFNARKNARTFAGDVGSISMAFMLVWMMIALMIHTREPGWILFFSVYGIDTVSTILIRLNRREDIFKAHRMHLYQLLANQQGWPHLKVAGIYALLQLVVNMATITLFFNGLLCWPAIITVMAVLWAAYIIIRRNLSGRRNCFCYLCMN